MSMSRGHFCIFTVSWDSSGSSNGLPRVNSAFRMSFPPTTILDSSKIRPFCLTVAKSSPVMPWVFGAWSTRKPGFGLMALKYVSIFVEITNSPPGEVASTGSESQLNSTVPISRISSLEDFPYFLRDSVSRIFSYILRCLRLFVLQTSSLLDYN